VIVAMSELVTLEQTILGQIAAAGDEAALGKKGTISSLAGRDAWSRYSR